MLLLELLDAVVAVGATVAAVDAAGVPVVEAAPLDEVVAAAVAAVVAVAAIVAAGVPVELVLLLDDELPELVLVALAPWLLLELPPVVGIFALKPAGNTTRCPGMSGKLAFALKKSRRFVPLRL